MVFLFYRGYYTLFWHTTFEFGKIANSNGWYVGFHYPSYPVLYSSNWGLRCSERQPRLMLFLLSFKEEKE